MEMTEILEENRRSHGIVNNRFVQIGVVVAALLSGIAVILISVNISINKMQTENKPNQKSPSELTLEEKTKQRFPGYFRTPEEQAEIEKLLNSSLPLSVNVTDHDIPEVGYYVNASSCSKDLQCTSSQSTTWRYIRFNPVYHGCCYSYNVYMVPTYWKDINGTVRKMAQFDGNKQHFLKEICLQVPGCGTCTCKQQPAYVTGVYEDRNKDYGIAWFKIDGCCKCVNT